MIKRLLLQPLAARPARCNRFLSATSAGEPSGPVKLGYPFSIPAAKQEDESIQLPDPIWSPAMEFKSWWKFHAIRLFINPQVSRDDFLVGCKQVFHRMNEIISAEKLEECDSICSDEFSSTLKETFERNAAKSSLRPLLEVVDLKNWIRDVDLTTKTVDSQLTQVWADVDVIFNCKGRVSYVDRETSLPVDEEKEPLQSKISMYRLRACLKDITEKQPMEWVITAIV